MIDFIMPVVKAFWEEEVPPKQWNEGIITSIWKGKGDRELMDNQRGITVSSSIGTIVEEIINQRVLRTVKFTQAQAGGKKGASPADNSFIVRNIMQIAKKEGRHLILSFFDVKKADMNNMLYILNQSGFKGKVWRLTKALNKDLTARVKTKAGMSRVIKRETGGKQGGKLMVPLFAKMMDKMAEDLSQDMNIGIQIDDSKIPAILFMDDLLIFSEGYCQQQRTLNAVSELGVKHKISTYSQHKSNF